MVYLSNMASLGGEHSSFQFYHAWFGDSNNNHSRINFIGKPTTIVEPDYPYFKGTDNHGVNDNKTSVLGPAPGFVPGGPDASYTGTASPPLNVSFYNRTYRDWNDQIVWTARTWEITENSIGYQGPYVALGAYFMSPTTNGCSSSTPCDDGLFCNGAETCASGTCVPGSAPCTGGQSCNEQNNQCVSPPLCDSDGLCEAGESCRNCLSDCPGRTNGPASRRYCCGDGIRQSAERGGEICDGNF